MRLSEAIRLGAMMKPQAFGDLFNKGGTCALGAALDANGCLPQELSFNTANDFEKRSEDYGRLRRLFPIVGELCRNPLEPHSSDISVRLIAIYLNDHQRWTRERIADWVSTLEPVETPDDIPEEAQKVSR